jgi:hypothetical protein
LLISANIALESSGIAVRAGLGVSRGAQFAHKRGGGQILLGFSRDAADREVSEMRDVPPTNI